MNLTALIPWPYRFLALAALGAALWGHGWLTARESAQEDLDAARLASTHVVVKWLEREAARAEKIVTKYVDRVQTVTETITQIEQLAPELRDDQDLARIYLPAAERVLHDAAATGGDPESARAALAGAAPVDLLTYTRTVRANYQQCRLTAEQLTSLQQWADTAEPLP
ncbi:hypothetical protein [Caldimonas sp. KR1-144]|uniref:hypothetical protein n=1 Tax=Caldimonas sp. KR1-144 TaxID=3400911 RepID=UPI003C087D25